MAGKNICGMAGKGWRETGGRKELARTYGGTELAGTYGGKRVAGKYCGERVARNTS